MRIREVEIHHVDLDLGYEATDWSLAFATRTLDLLTPALRAHGQMPVSALTASDTRSAGGRPATARCELDGTTQAHCSPG